MHWPLPVMTSLFDKTVFALRGTTLFMGQQHLELNTNTVISLHASLPGHYGGLMSFLQPSTRLRVE